jgi:hypothetical protein
MSVTLPDVNSDAGLLARLFLAEARNPGHGSYNADDAARGMRSMKAVVHNRLHRNPAQFGAPGATSFLDIATAPGQFHGFSKSASGQLQIAADVSDRINTIVNNANSGPPGKYHAFVELAIQVAQSPVDDPFTGVTSIGGIAVTGGAYGWRTEGSSSPGGNFVAIPVANGGVIAGNQFYTLKVTVPHGGAAVSSDQPLATNASGATFCLNLLGPTAASVAKRGWTPEQSGTIKATSGSVDTCAIGGAATGTGATARPQCTGTVAMGEPSMTQLSRSTVRGATLGTQGTLGTAGSLGATAGTGGTIGSFCGCGGTFGTAGSAGGSTQLTGAPVSGATLGTQGTLGTAGSLGATAGTGGTIGSFCGCGGTFGTAGSAGGSTRLSGSPASGATAGTSGTAGTNMCVFPSTMPATFQGASIGTQATFCARSQQ